MKDLTRNFVDWNRVRVVGMDLGDRSTQVIGVDAEGLCLVERRVVTEGGKKS